MATQDFNKVDTNDTGLPIPGHEHDPPRSQALEEGGRVLTERAIQRMQERDWGETRPVPAQKLPCETSANPGGADDVGKHSAPAVNQTLTAEGDLVERLARVLRKTAISYAPATFGGNETVDAFRQRMDEGCIRAVIDELANMAHANAIPTVQAYAEELLGECGQHVPMPAWDDLDPARQACFLDMANAARNLALAALAAKDARLAELAAMGGEALPSDETVEDLALDILHNHASDDEDAALKIAQAVLRQCHEFIMPILAAKDATIAEQKRTIEVQTACIVAVVSERDAALAEVARLKAEAEAMARRVRILEIAPFAAHYAHNKTGRGYCPEDAAAAAHAITHSDAPTDWAKAVLEYTAKWGGLNA